MHDIEHQLLSWDRCYTKEIWPLGGKQVEKVLRVNIPSNYLTFNFTVQVVTFLIFFYNLLQMLVTLVKHISTMKLKHSFLCLTSHFKVSVSVLSIWIFTNKYIKYPHITTHFRLVKHTLHRICSTYKFFYTQQGKT